MGKKLNPLEGDFSSHGAAMMAAGQQYANPSKFHLLSEDDLSKAEALRTGAAADMKSANAIAAQSAGDAPVTKQQIVDNTFPTFQNAQAQGRNPVVQGLAGAYDVAAYPLKEAKAGYQAVGQGLGSLLNLGPTPPSDQSVEQDIAGKDQNIVGEQATNPVNYIPGFGEAKALYYGGEALGKVAPFLAEHTPAIAEKAGSIIDEMPTIVNAAKKTLDNIIKPGVQGGLAGLASSYANKGVDWVKGTGEDVNSTLSTGIGTGIGVLSNLVGKGLNKFGLGRLEESIKVNPSTQVNAKNPPDLNNLVAYENPVSGKTENIVPYSGDNKALSQNVSDKIEELNSKQEPLVQGLANNNFAAPAVGEAFDRAEQDALEKFLSGKYDGANYKKAMDIIGQERANMANQFILRKGQQYAEPTALGEDLMKGFRPKDVLADPVLATDARDRMQKYLQETNFNLSTPHQRDPVTNAPLTWEGKPMSEAEMDAKIEEGSKHWPANDEVNGLHDLFNTDRPMTKAEWDAVVKSSYTDNIPFDLAYRARQRMDRNAGWSKANDPNRSVVDEETYQNLRGHINDKLEPSELVKDIASGESGYFTNNMDWYKSHNNPMTGEPWTEEDLLRITKHTEDANTVEAQAAKKAIDDFETFKKLQAGYRQLMPWDRPLEQAAARSTNAYGTNTLELLPTILGATHAITGHGLAGAGIGALTTGAMHVAKKPGLGSAFYDLGNTLTNLKSAPTLFTRQAVADAATSKEENKKK